MSRVLIKKIIFFTVEYVNFFTSAATYSSRTPTGNPIESQYYYNIYYKMYQLFYL